LRVPGRGDEATLALEKALRLQPDNERARRMLINLRASQP